MEWAHVFVIIGTLGTFTFFIFRNLKEDIKELKNDVNSPKKELNSKIDEIRKDISDIRVDLGKLDTRVEERTFKMMPYQEVSKGSKEEK